MKKAHTVSTISAHEQLVIMQWYSITKKLFCLLIMVLTACTFTYWYLQNYYMRTCRPAISAAYAEMVAKKHATQAVCVRNQKQKEAELQKSSAMIANYAGIINLHIDATHNAQLTELKLSPSDIIARYAVPNRNSIQSCIDKLSESSAVVTVSLESVEQKNNASTCTIHALWKK